MAARRGSNKKSARPGAKLRGKTSAGKTARKRAAAPSPARKTAKKRPAAASKRASRAITKSTPKSAKTAPKPRPKVTKTLALVKKAPAKKAAAPAAPAAPAVPAAAAATRAAAPVAARKAATPTKRVAAPGKKVAASVPEFTPAFEPQRQIANPKELLLFELQRARVAVMAAIQGVSGGTADKPTQPGKWSVREIVLHLIVRDRVRLDEFAAVLGGARPSWIALDEVAMARMNELHLGPLRPLSWDEAVRLLQATREQLMSALISVSSYPAEMWTDAHPFGAMLRALPVHDRHHAEQIKNARIEG